MMCSVWLTAVKRVLLRSLCGTLLAQLVLYYGQREVGCERSRVKIGGTDLVPVAVVFGRMVVVLQNFRDGALVDPLQTQLPLTQLQETPVYKRWVYMIGGLVLHPVHV